MKYIEEYRDRNAALKLAKLIGKVTTKHWTIMEVCGGQTHAIVKFGLPQLLPPQIELIHGPGCPVCVTPIELIDQALEICKEREVIFCSFGDMLRVPGSNTNLLTEKAQGADVRIVYSPLDALNLARLNPNKTVVFFAVGFETTAPTTAMTAYLAKNDNVNNFFMLVSHVLVPPAIEAILSSDENRVQGFLAAGHVCTVMGYSEYEPLSTKYKVPIVVTGFEPLDILQGIYLCVLQLEEGRHQVENQYARSVSREGNLKAQEIIKAVFKVVPRKWRGMGEILHSGLDFNEDYSFLDAGKKFGLSATIVSESQEYLSEQECRSGQILQGRIKPDECPAFASRCTPLHPLGAPMVSAEGACAAYYQHRRYAGIGK